MPVLLRISCHSVHRMVSGVSGAGGVRFRPQTSQSQLPRLNASYWHTYFFQCILKVVCNRFDGGVFSRRGRGRGRGGGRGGTRFRPQTHQSTRYAYVL